ncbi:DsbA family protein [Desemzia sp. RIT804]|uniref:thioredoxin domain-containing protein n=1 Tax=Desemzia sp. RIT 804 TaxID=2810209 RepID=UPI001950825F|nr:thioredoxin domain-containing protein [Desemzia sp. RIT 804]MBM6615699.1 DsbA family protein [Desemzia sp. RIT 804]
MDISNIKADKVNTTYGFKIGQENAPVKVIEFINLRCPFCKKWYFDSKDVLNEYVHEGKIQRIIKLFDKEKPSLKKGNVVHHHLDYKDPEEALIEIDYFLTHQDEWGYLGDLEQVAEYVTEKRGLTHQPNEIEINGIINEANEANVVLVPSVFIGDNIFDEHITPVELKSLIDLEVAKNKN